MTPIPTAFFGTLSEIVYQFPHAKFPQRPAFCVQCLGDSLLRINLQEQLSGLIFGLHLFLKSRLVSGSLMRQVVGVFQERRDSRMVLSKSPLVRRITTYIVHVILGAHCQSQQLLKPKTVTYFHTQQVELFFEGLEMFAMLTA
jgi:hypothetical protein